MKDKLNILLVEDDPNDVYFLLYAFEQAGLRNPTQVVEDGQQAIEYLSGAGKYADRTRHPIPYLILLDLKLPKVMGLDVLHWLNSRPELCMVLVIILTSSNDASDITEAYRCGARSYLVKPHSLSERLELAKCIKSYWIELNSAPPLDCTPAPPKSPDITSGVPAQRTAKAETPAQKKRKNQETADKRLS